MRVLGSWTPAAVLAVGALATLGGVREPIRMPLERQLTEAIPAVIAGYDSEDIVIAEAEQRIAGMDDYVLRFYSPIDAVEEDDGFSVYVGYYEQQGQGHSIHSPRNCLPGGGWEPLTSSRERIETRSGEIPVNRYLIGNGPAKAIVLYWYQGRGRIEANEYAVKWDLLRDQALHGRSDEALVRVVVPVVTSEEAAYEKAVLVAQTLVDSVWEAIPAGPGSRGNANGYARPTAGQPSTELNDLQRVPSSNFGSFALKGS